MLISLDGQQTLIASLSRLGLGQVLRPQGDGLHHIDWHQDPLCRQQLGTALVQKNKTKQNTVVEPTDPQN